MSEEGIRKKIAAKAVELLEEKENSSGLRFRELRNRINENKEYRKGTISATLSALSDKQKKTIYKPEIYKPARGLYRHVKYKEETSEQNEEAQVSIQKAVKEEDFYKPFSDWLVNEIEDADKAIPLGGSTFKDKWATPDVIGKKEANKSDIIQGQIEIISAEIKSDKNQLITAFGQVCAYKLFSHKCYLVIPKNSSEENLAKLDSLCQLFGIDLILFDTEDAQNPNFEIRVRPRKHEPDLFYTNRYMKEIELDLFR